MGDDVKTICIKVSAEMLEKIKTAGSQRGLTAGVYIRTLLYEKFTTAE